VAGARVRECIKSREAVIFGGMMSLRQRRKSVQLSVGIAELWIGTGLWVIGVGIWKIAQIQSILIALDKK
jgi:hypothetical protein